MKRDAPVRTVNGHYYLATIEPLARDGDRFDLAVSHRYGGCEICEERQMVETEYTKHTLWGEGLWEVLGYTFGPLFIAAGATMMHTEPDNKGINVALIISGAAISGWTTANLIRAIDPPPQTRHVWHLTGECGPVDCEDFRLPHTALMIMGTPEHQADRVGRAASCADLGERCVETDDRGILQLDLGELALEDRELAGGSLSVVLPNNGSYEAPPSVVIDIRDTDAHREAVERVERAIAETDPAQCLKLAMQLWGYEELTGSVREHCRGQVAAEQAFAAGLDSANEDERAIALETIAAIGTSSLVPLLVSRIDRDPQPDRVADLLDVVQPRWLFEGPVPEDVAALAAAVEARRECEDRASGNRYAVLKPRLDEKERKRDAALSAGAAALAMAIAGFNSGNYDSASSSLQQSDPEYAASLQRSVDALAAEIDALPGHVVRRGAKLLKELESRAQAVAACREAIEDERWKAIVEARFGRVE